MITKDVTRRALVRKLPGRMKGPRDSAVTRAERAERTPGKYDGACPRRTGAPTHKRFPSGKTKRPRKAGTIDGGQLSRRKNRTPKRNLRRNQEKTADTITKAEQAEKENRDGKTELKPEQRKMRRLKRENPVEMACVGYSAGYLTDSGKPRIDIKVRGGYQWAAFTVRKDRALQGDEKRKAPTVCTAP